MKKRCAFVPNDHPNPYLCYWEEYNVVLDLTNFAKKHPGGDMILSALQRTGRELTGKFGPHTSHWRLPKEKVIQALTPYVVEGKFPQSTFLRNFLNFFH